MRDILNVIAGLKGLRHLTPAKKTEVFLAECALDLRFADEYKTYLTAYGLISARGIEITGLLPSPRLNVVDVTKRERAWNEGFPPDMYVIEETGVEGLLILQDAAGTIYALWPGKQPKKEFDCLADYLFSLQQAED